MSDDMSRAGVARQLKYLLESLQSAGVTLLPGNRNLGKTFTEGPEPPPARSFVPPSMSLSTKLPPKIEAPPPVAVVSPLPPVQPTIEPVIPIGAEERRRELRLLAEKVASCNRCPELFGTRTQAVFGVGPVDADVCFIGEAPGADEDARGEPFVGRAGQLLDKIIAASGFKREEVYICNTIKCRPPNNRQPTQDERRNCREYFDHQIALVRPRFIVCLGATAAKNVLNTTLGIGTLRGSIRDYKGIPVVCTYHPSALLRDETPGQDLKRACWDDMKMLLRAMGRPIPGTG